MVSRHRVLGRWEKEIEHKEAVPKDIAAHCKHLPE